MSVPGVMIAAALALLGLATPDARAEDAKVTPLLTHELGDMDGKEVLMLTADDRPPYRRPPLTKELLRGELPESELPMVPEGWYGANNLRLDITGKTTMRFDIMTVGSGTETAVAVQYGNDEWCQLTQPWDWVPARTDLRTVTVELETLSDCSGVEPTSTSRNTLTAVWIWFGGDGSFRLDNVRVE